MNTIERLNYLEQENRELLKENLRLHTELINRTTREANAQVDKCRSFDMIRQSQTNVVPFPVYTN